MVLRLSTAIAPQRVQRPHAQAEIVDERPTRGVCAPPQRYRAPAIRIAFARSRCSSSVCILPSGTKMARTDPWRGLSENSPRSSRASTSRTVSRTLRPTSSFLPCSDSVGIADEFSTRRTTDWPAFASSSAASAFAQQRLVRSRRLHALEAVEAPEPIVDRVHLHARRAASALLRRDEPFGDDQRHGLLERARQLLAEESLRHDDAIGPAEPLQARDRAGSRGPTRRPSARRPARRPQWRRRR